MLYISDVFFKATIGYICWTGNIHDCYFSKFFYKNSLFLVYNYASSFILFYNDYIFIVYFTLRSAFNTISTEREKLKQLMEQDVSASPSAQVLGLKHALSSVSYTSVSQQSLAVCLGSWTFYVFHRHGCVENSWENQTHYPNYILTFHQLILLILNTKAEPTPNLSSKYFIEH